MKRAIAKQVFGKRKWAYDERNDGYESPVNMESTMFYGWGDVARFELILGASVSGQAITDLGDVPDMLMTDANAAFYEQEWEFTKHSQTLTLTNINPHNLYITVHELVATATKPYNNTITNESEDCAADVYASLLAQQGTATSSTSKTGGANYTLSGRRIDSYVPINFKNSALQDWKCIRRRSVVLKPGDVAKYTMHINNLTYKRSRFYDTSSLNKVSDIIRGITKCCAVSFHGPLGRSTVDNEHSVVGWLQGDIAIETARRATLLPLWGHKRVAYHHLTHDDLTAKAMEHPADHEMKEENA